MGAAEVRLEFKLLIIKSLQISALDCKLYE
jgi:hypothetical protein